MIDAYLRRLGVPRRAPSVEYLFELHRAHVERATYSNLQIIRRAPAGIDAGSAMREIVDCRGGYCFHLNSAFAGLLRDLGFSVSMHRGYVANRDVEDESQARLNHLALVVHDLPGVWFVDAGLGDAIYEPLPLTPGSYTQGPFTYGLQHALHREGWRFVHDDRGSFSSMEFESAAARLEDFHDAHEFLSTSPDSSFLRFLTAQVRRADAVETVRGCVRIVIDENGRHEWLLDDPQEWLATLVRMGLPADVADLWPQTRVGYEAWLAGK